MSPNNLKSLYVDELRDLYNSEQQLIKALPKMAKAANSDELRKGFEGHLEQTRQHATRLEQILSGLGEPANGKKCKGIAGIVAEGREMMSEDFQGALMDAALISAASTRGALRNRRLRRGARLRRVDGRERSSLITATDTR
jgi:ferritin-like metal-binding protein YciE